ncbi:hypothetical protein [Actinoplanes regularis]|nr:hypothetical protein [Actinoplanes regularis]
MTLFAPQINGALFLDTDDVLWFVPGLEPGHWDWRSATRVNPGHPLFEASDRITDLLRDTNEGLCSWLIASDQTPVLALAGRGIRAKPGLFASPKGQHFMTKAIVGIVVVVIFACFGLPMLLMSAVMGGGSGACSPAVAPSIDASGQPAGTGQWDTDQLNITVTIIEVGVTKGVGSWGQTIALAVAMQESGLRNLPYLGDANDHDSIGVFQQRPSQGWGTPEQLADPAYQAGKFYDKLKTIPGWQRMPLTEAAQAVQGSAYPGAYAKWTNDAIALVDRYGTGEIALDCSNMPFGSAEPAPRNPDGSWPEETCSIVPDPTTGTGCLTPRTFHFVQQATTAGWPKPGCWDDRDKGEHPLGRACDFMMTPGEEAHGAAKARGAAMAAWAVANADRLGIMYVIWYRMIWTDDGRGWHAYDNPWGGNDPGGWHTNHVHISMH